MVASCTRTLPNVTSPMLILIAAGIAAATDWWAVATDRHRVEVIAKPMTMALLVAVAALAGDAPPGVRAFLVAGACLGLVGDVALLGDGDRAFMVGLGAFALGHVAYAVAAFRTDFVAGWAVAGVIFAGVLLAFRFVSRTLPGARDAGGGVLAGAVVFYAAVITAMVATAWATTIVPAAVGASLFAISDWVLGHERFVGPLPGGRVAVHVPYHIGQALLLVALATA